MHHKSLGHPTDIRADIHSGEEQWPDGGLLLPGYPPEIFLGELEEGLELAHPVIADVSGASRSTRLLQEPDGFLVVGLG